MRSSAGRSLTAVVLAAALNACGPVMYTSAVNKAEDALVTARENNAHWYAPYEYHYAQANLDKAYEEASRAQYEDAVKLARAALDYAGRALRLAERQRFEEP